MDKKKTLTIFHIYRKDDTSLLLHPFTDDNRLFELLDGVEVQGRYGREPRVESFTIFRNEFYRMTESAVKNWVAEKKFIPHFLLAAGLFLVTYFLFSFAIRDPLPMVDEVIIALAASIGLYVFLARRDNNSDLAARKRVDVRNKIDQIRFTEDELVKEVEDFLKNMEDEPLPKVLDYITSLKEGFFADEKEEARQLLSYIELRYDKKDIKKQDRFISSLADEEEREKNSDRFMRWIKSRKIDPAIVAAYAYIKKGLHGVPEGGSTRLG